ncbi:MAG: hypothetical protein NTW03_02855 [Verrucomicrobia bacterium]|nr:hypothetical protein [Verrucomicrobiota bacterium]
MANLQAMPAIVLPASELMEIGREWNAATSILPKSAGEQVGRLCDRTVGAALAQMLGGIPAVAPLKSTSLLPPQPDCVEIGPARVIGGIRPQNFDVAYRPDGVRFAYDSKTLNTRSSLSKNYQNMLNDLGTEAATVHTRFPSALVGLIVAVPEPCLGNHRKNLTSALIRLSGRKITGADVHKAEAIGLLVWNPADGTVDGTWPAPGSPLRIENFPILVEQCYTDRFAGLPPHNEAE